MSVRLVARALLYDRKSMEGLVGRVFRHDGKQVIFVTEVTVPLVDYAYDGDIEPARALEAATDGDYMMQLSLPDGAVHAEGFSITGGEANVEVSIAHTGPQEWTSLQAMTGQLPSREVSHLGDEPLSAPFGPGYPTDRSYEQLSSNPQRGFGLLFLDMDGPVGDSPLRHEEALPEMASLCAEDQSVEQVLSVIGGGRAIVRPSEEDDRFALFELVRGGALSDGAERQSYYFGPGTESTRAYVLAVSGAGADLLCLPLPWTREGEEVEVQLMLDKHSLPDTPRYTVTIADPMINSALGYIRNGALHDAARLIDRRTAEKLLFNKISSPLAATIGGYLLLLGLDRKAYAETSSQWQNWVDNLCGWFDWLPDGAVLHSARYFVLGDLDRDSALESLKRAFERGLPFFTFGLHLMLEGTRRFAAEGDPWAKKQLRTLEAIAAVADPAQDFLSLRLAQHWRSEGGGIQMRPMMPESPATQTLWSESSARAMFYSDG